MGSIIVVMPKTEDGKRIRDMLGKYGLQVTALCTTASMALTKAHQMDSGVVVCSFRLPDMHYSQLAEYLPEYFDMLLLISAAEVGNCPEGVIPLTYPVKPGDLAGTVGMMLGQLQRRLKKKKTASQRRTPGAKLHQQRENGFDGAQSHDGAGGVPLYPEKLYGFRNQHGGNGTDDPPADVRRMKRRMITGKRVERNRKNGFCE